jgi:hypothetical protein
MTLVMSQNMSKQLTNHYLILEPHKKTMEKKLQAGIKEFRGKSKLIMTTLLGKLGIGKLQKRMTLTFPSIFG